MSKNRTTRPYPVSANTTHSLPVGEAATYYLTGSPNMSGGSTIIQASGTPAEGMIVWMNYALTPTNYDESTASITIFGKVVPSEISAKSFIAIAEYVSGAWKTLFLTHWGNGTATDNMIATNMIQDDAVTTAKLDSTPGAEAVSDSVIRDNSVTLAKMASMTNDGFIGNDSGGNADPQHLTVTETRTLLAQAITLTGDITGGPTTETAATGVTTISTSLAANSVDSAEIAAGAVGVSELATTVKTEMIVVPLSFEANEVGKIYIEVPFACTVQEITASVSKLIAVGNDGTITLANNGGGNMTGGTITCVDGDGIGTNYSSTVTANNTLSAGQTIDISTAKATAGGKVILVINLLRT